MMSIKGNKKGKKCEWYVFCCVNEIYDVLSLILELYSTTDADAVGDKKKSCRSFMVMKVHSFKRARLATYHWLAFAELRNNSSSKEKS